MPQVYNDFALIFQGLSISDDDELPIDMEALKRKISEVFLTRTREEWASVFEARVFLTLCVDWCSKISPLKEEQGRLACNKAQYSEICFQEIDACVTPVLELDEAKEWEHHVERGAFAKNQQGQLDPVSERECNINF